MLSKFQFNVIRVVFVTFVLLDILSDLVSSANPIINVFNVFGSGVTNTIECVCFSIMVAEYHGREPFFITFMKGAAIGYVLLVILLFVFVGVLII